MESATVVAKICWRQHGRGAAAGVDGLFGEWVLMGVKVVQGYIAAEQLL